MSEHYDAIIIGSGQAAIPLATALASSGWRTALVERKQLGGTCVNTGCTPTKALVGSAKVASLARRAAEYGVEVDAVAVNFKAVRDRKRKIVEDSRAGSESRVRNAKGLDLLRGEGRFDSPNSVIVALNDGGEQQLSADKIILNVGARATRPKIEGIDQVTVLNEESLMELDALPQHLIIIGGGNIGLEFGQIFRRFGSEVTIIEAGKQLAGREDTDIAAAVADILREDGISILLESKVRRLEPTSDGGVQVSLSGAQGDQSISGSHLLIAVGRTPNTDKLNLAAAGVETDERGFIRVDEHLQTNVSGIFALGDVNGGPQFTHIAYDDFRIVRDQLLEGKARSTKERPVPYVMYIDPQLGRIGLTEAQARERYPNLKVAQLPMSHVARAIETGETRGFMKVLINGDNEQILGCAILGAEGGEIMSMIQLAMMGELPYTTLRDAVWAHPTLAEALNNLFNL
ncbi:MAG: mercuric reductase [Anaerolineae bacterium]